MTTKEQERKALEKIRKILEDLEENSYVMTALTGMLDDAETNIENDWALSMYDRWQMAEQKYEHANAEAEKLRETVARGTETIDTLIGQLDALTVKHRELDDHDTKTWNSYCEQKDRTEALELENMKLKAKLYDLMTAGA